MVYSIHIRISKSVVFVIFKFFLYCQLRVTQYGRRFCFPYPVYYGYRFTHRRLLDMQQGVTGIESSNGAVCCVTGCGQCGGAGCSAVDLPDYDVYDCCVTEILGYCAGVQCLQKRVSKNIHPPPPPPSTSLLLYKIPVPSSLPRNPRAY